MLFPLLKRKKRKKNETKERSPENGKSIGEKEALRGGSPPGIYSVDRPVLESVSRILFNWGSGMYAKFVTTLSRSKP